jgi:zinc transporter ZupT
VLEAFGLGLLGASSLLFAGLLACWLDVPARLVGVLAGFGAGALIAAVSFDLVVEAEDVLEGWQFGVWMLIGVAVFLVADQVVEKRFGTAGVGVQWASSSARWSTACRSRSSSGSRSARASDQLELPGRCLHLQHPAEHRAVRRPLGLWLERETRRNALVLGRPRLRRRSGARLSGHGPDVRGSGWSSGLPLRTAAFSQC